MTDSRSEGGMYKVNLKYIVPEIKEVLKKGVKICQKGQRSQPEGAPKGEIWDIKYNENNEY